MIIFAGCHVWDKIEMKNQPYLSIHSPCATPWVQPTGVHLQFCEFCFWVIHTDISFLTMENDFSMHMNVCKKKMKINMSKRYQRLNLNLYKKFECKFRFLLCVNGSVLVLEEVCENLNAIHNNCYRY